MRRDVRILFVGDGTFSLNFVLHEAVLLTVMCACGIRVIVTEGVGKSTIVTSLIKEAFVPHVRT